MRPKMDFQISGRDGKQVWIAYSRTRASADHLAELFFRMDYDNVLVVELTD